MKKTKSLFTLGFVLACFGAAAGCSSEGPALGSGAGGAAGQSQGGGQCGPTQACPAGSECSAGNCVPFTACGGAATCAAGLTCQNGVCRMPCTSDANCASQGLICDLAAGFCKPNPGSGAGGAAGVGGSAGAGGSGAAGAAGAGAGGVSGSSSNGGTSSAGASGASAGGSSGSGNFEPSVTPGSCVADLGGYQNGSVTFYYLDQGTQLVHCSYPETARNPDKISSVLTGDGMYFGAMNTADYSTAAACGACVEVTRDGSKKVTITIADECPIATNNKCKTGHIDLSREAFKQLGQESEGYLGTSNGGAVGQISWKYVPCPTGETVSLTLKEPSNMYWNQILVAGNRYAIEKVQVLVEGAWIDAARTEYNYWEPPNGTLGMPPYRVRVIDVNGSILETEIQLTAGAQDSGLQFTCE